MGILTDGPNWKGRRVANMLKLEWRGLKIIVGTYYSRYLFLAEQNRFYIHTAVVRHSQHWHNVLATEDETGLICFVFISVGLCNEKQLLNYLLFFGQLKLSAGNLRARTGTSDS